MKILIDGDIVCYRCAASAEGDPVEVALMRIENQIVEIATNCGLELDAQYEDSVKIFLSGESNFRYDIYPEYKANRTQPKPKWLQECREYLVTYWGAKVTEGIEADDALGMEQTKESIIASDDKDMLQIPGHHYNIRTQQHLQVTEDEAVWMLYYQLLVGDGADNIKGCKGIGKVKANRALEVGMSEWEMFEVVRNLYNNDEELLMNARVLKIQQQQGEPLWSFPEQPIIELEPEAPSVFMQQMVG
jgi:DNA polymerase I